MKEISVQEMSALGGDAPLCLHLILYLVTVGANRGRQLERSMLHPLVLPQPFVRGCFTVTMVTSKCGEQERSDLGAAPNACTPSFM